MLEAIQGLFRITSLGINLIIGFFRDVIQVIVMLVSLASRLSDYLSFFPPVLGVILASLLVIVILYKVLGREG